MNWTKLWSEFLSGDPSAIQAIFSILGFIASLAGIYYVVVSFRIQRKINQQQLNLNRLADEKDKREQFAWFWGIEEGIKEGAISMKFSIYLEHNSVLDLEIFPISSDGELKTPIYFPSQVVNPSNSKPFHTFEIIPLSNIVPGQGYKKVYLVYYTDQVGRPYTVDIGHTGEKCVCLYPQAKPFGFRNELPPKREV